MSLYWRNESKPPEAHTHSFLSPSVRMNFKKLNTTIPHTELANFEKSGGETTSSLQGWDDLPRDVLIKIFKLLPIEHVLHSSMFALVCKSWLSAAVDIVYPSTTVLDLRILSTFHKKLRNKCRVYFMVLLNTRPQTQWTTLYQPEKASIDEIDFLYIAQRSPCLQYLVWPSGPSLYLEGHWKTVCSWKNLKGIDLRCWLDGTTFKPWALSLGSSFKNLRYLSLVGTFGVDEGISDMIKILFPRIEYLSLKGSTLTMDAAALVVAEVAATNFSNSSKVGIHTLDLQHCLFVSFYPRFDRRPAIVDQGLVNVEIHEKAAATIKTYLRCEWHSLCPDCVIKRTNCKYRAQAVYLTAKSFWSLSPLPPYPKRSLQNDAIPGCWSRRTLKKKRSLF